MSMETSPIAKSGYRSALFVLLVLMVAIGAYALGRQSAPPNPDAARNLATAPGHGADEEHGPREEGIVVFDEASLKLANLAVEPVALRSLRSHLPATGTVEPNLGGVVKVTSRVAGRITAVSVNVGDNVQAGQPLAQLSSMELADAQAAYRQAKSRVALAANHLQRQRKLADFGEFGRHKVEEARQREIEAHGEINAALNDVAAAKNEVAEARSEKAALQGDVAKAENEVASAESEIREAESQVRALRAALEQSQTQVKVAQSKFNRYDVLLKEQLVSRQDWEQAQADHQRALSDVDAARANIEQGQAKVATAQAHRSAAQAQARAAGSRVQQASDKIETAISRQAQQESRLATAHKRDEVAEQVLAREERVYKGGFFTSKEIVEAQAGLQLAQAEQRAAADTIRLLGGSVGGGTTLTVTAPLAGRVTERLVTLGETVDPTRSLFTVINLNSVWVQLAVSQRDIASMRIGQAVQITSDTAPGRTFRGAVSYIGDVVDTATRTVKVRAVIQNLGNVLKPQTFVRGRIATEARASVLAVPSEAVQSHEGKTVVFVQGDHPGEFEAKEVETAETVDGLTEITSGLEPGAKVVTRGAFTVKAQAMKADLGHEH